MKRVAIALIAVLALFGCSEIGSLSDKAQIDLALDNLTTELDAVAGIQTEYTAELQADFTYQVYVHATAPQLDDEQLLAAALLARDSLSEGVFDRTQVSFDLAVPEGALLSMWDFTITEDALRDELALAAAVGEAYGSAATLSIGQGEDGPAVGVQSAAPSPDWDAIRSLVADNPGRYWGFPGLSFDGAVPPAQLTDLVDAIGGILPLGFTDEVYVSVDWYGETTSVTVAAPDVDVADPTASSYWPQAQQVAALIASSPLPSRSLMFYGLDQQGTATVFFGECAQSAVLSDSDAVLATALGSGAQPGLCA